jgi:hypothetical protein
VVQKDEQCSPHAAVASSHPEDAASIHSYRTVRRYKRGGWGVTENASWLKPLYQAGATLLQLAGKTEDQERGAVVDWYTIPAISASSIYRYFLACSSRTKRAASYVEPWMELVHDVNYFN